MAIPCSIKEREQDKFSEASDGSTAVNVTIKDLKTGAALVDVCWDYVEVAYPNTTTEVYTFKDGGAAGTTTATVTLVYVTSSKKDLSTATVVKV